MAMPAVGADTSHFYSAAAIEISTTTVDFVNSLEL